MNFFERLTALMKENGLSQAALEKEIGISNGSVTKWKESTPNSNTMNKLAEYFGVTTQYLLTGEDRNFSAKEAILDAKISNDPELKKALEKYFTLSDTRKRIVLNLIEELYNVEL